MNDLVHATLCFIVKDGRILLIMKKRGFGKGYWNGPGGKVDNGELPINCAIRELEEEIGVTPLNLKNRGKLEFFMGDDDNWLVHIFVSDNYNGTIIETEEAIPKWYQINQIPFDKMWDDDKYWLPLVLENKVIQGKFWYANDMKSLINYDIQVIN